MAAHVSTFTRRAFLGLLGTTALVRATGGPGRAQARTTGSFRAPPLMTPAPTTGPGQFDAPAWATYADSFADFVETWRDQPIARERPPLDLAPGDYARIDRFYAVAALSRDGVELTRADGTTARLWSPVYADRIAPEAASLRAVGPTMEFTRGEITGVWLTNDLQVCGTNPEIAPDAPDAGYTPHNFNYTNLHTHGLHVTPRAPSDDVLVTVVPDEIKEICLKHPDAITAEDPATFPYFYDVPDDHPVGTFWYHPHMHGAVASQVGAGMAGALLIRSKPGEIDLDEALAIHCNITRDDERIMVLQQIAYNTRPEAGTGIYVADNFYASTPAQNFACTPSILPGSPTYQAGSAVTAVTSVNGMVTPTLAMAPGEILRFRMINATNGTNYIPKFRILGDAPAGQPLPEVYAIAVDGIPLYPVNPADDPEGRFAPDAPWFPIDYDQPRPEDGDTSHAARRYWTTAELITLAPAQRLDLLVKAPDIQGAEEVRFALAGVPQYDTPASGTSPGTAARSAPNVLDNEEAGKAATDGIVTVVVSGPPRTDQSLPHMAFFEVAALRRLPGLGQANLVRPELPLADMPGAAQPDSLSVAEMLARWRASFAAAAETVTTPSLGVTDPHWKSLNFAFVAEPDPDGTPANFQINGQSFDADLSDDPQLMLPASDWTAWELYSSSDLHMFHIHINSFMVLGRYRVSAPDDPEAITSFIPYLLPIWRDTVYFDAGNDATATPLTGRRVAALSYQVDFTGEFVFHCHSLYHEDNGMMFTVEIA
ncbi:multicopper oxidase [Dinoroseobacter shibae DFL 12 = DSM 16493]|jgi:FtsP/CotA-like multicopper oxidase with cupredoxin domain|uniref:Multicopper oxidase n=1 Tax=Dinoroseobacter shibae (strain DSM 16493 / NCIMB 14021 / DFL 12) TaxID=398580 RepID=A8LJU1_DINSH|nr:multicopper oxidase domain-containing protein [Dinoroseobacter shibae]ABV91767.1 multicopper oxidase [Dinoroseobacter shibae DFL 12 = DSM 16493]URF46749.1 multicopper oxidase domain-containing protein [Dinoroseobacter shibae]URF51060.1 multicopper oxidase domain-containing protein [Dinoroseobacter shibae]